MSLGTYIRTRRGAAIFAVLLALLARVAINARWEFEAGFPESRTWVLLTIPFRLLEHTQYFWLEAALMLGVAVLVMGLTRNFTARAALPAWIALFAVDALVIVVTGAIAVIGGNRIIAAEALPIPPASWGVIAVDMTSVLLRNAFSIGIAAVGAWVVSFIHLRMKPEPSPIDSAG